jgi:hypothetical protein
MGWYGDVGPVRLSYNSYFSACFFSRNSVFLSQQISEQYFQPWLFSEANGLVSVHVSMHRCSTTLSPSLFTGFIGVDSWIVWQLSGIGEDGGSAWATQIEALVGLVGWPRLAFFIYRGGHGVPPLETSIYTSTDSELVGCLPLLMCSARLC